MDAHAISADVVRDALRAIRYGQRLDGNALLGLGALTERLRAAGVSDSSASRAWELGRWLDGLTATALSDARRVGTAQDLPVDRGTQKDDLTELLSDFEPGRIDLEARVFSATVISRQHRCSSRRWLTR